MKAEEVTAVCAWLIVIIAMGFFAFHLLTCCDERPDRPLISIKVKAK